MPDLKLTKEDALKLVGAEADKHMRYFRDEADRIAEQLVATSEALTQKRPIDIATAEVAAVVEFVQLEDAHDHRAALHLGLNGPRGGGAATTELGRGLRPGRYRAIVLINRIGNE